MGKRNEKEKRKRENEEEVEETRKRIETAKQRMKRFDPFSSSSEKDKRDGESSSSSSSCDDQEKTKNKINSMKPFKPSLHASTKKPTGGYQKCQLFAEYLVIQRRQSILITGGGGCGKSFLLGYLVSRFRQTFNRETDDRIAVTATTGIAAVQVNGITIHTWSGIHYLFSYFNHQQHRQEEEKNQVNDDFEILSNLLPRSVIDRWKQVNVLIIDEVSMLDATMFDRLNWIGKTLRQSGKPFGGIQIVLFGDLFQLPPVSVSISSSSSSSTAEATIVDYIFTATCWNRTIRQTAILESQYRQSQSDLIFHLESIRRLEKGTQLPSSTITFFQNLKRKIDDTNTNQNLEPARLYSKRIQVDKYNHDRLNKIKDEKMITYQAIDYILPDIFSSDLNDQQTRQKKAQILSEIHRNCIAPKIVQIKVNSQVMLIKNLNRHHHPDDDDGVENSKQLVNGRIGTVISMDSESATVEFPSLSTHSEPTKIRLIAQRFLIHDVKSNQLVAIRKQIPLILAWALSIHKSQGQTLPLVQVDLNQTFKTGQVYVALSRATCKETFQVLNFLPEKVKTNSQVNHWYRQVEREDRKYKDEWIQQQKKQKQRHCEKGVGGPP